MKVLELHNESLALTLAPGQEEHIVLLHPENVSLTVTQQEGSVLRMHIVSLEDASSKVIITVDQQATACRTELYGLALTRGEQHLDLETHVLHSVGGGYSNQLIKNVLMDDSECTFWGELKVLPEAQQTEAYQTNRNILLSNNARVRTRPQLEIYADDVKCAHGATTGQLDEQALFYMRQRGIAEQDARRLLLSAFLEDVLSTLPDEALVASLVEKIASRL